MNCAICGYFIDTIEELIGEKWALSFFEGESEHGPLCPSCAETLTSISPDGEYELKDEFKGKIVYNDYVERYEKGPLDDVILGFILN